MGVSQNEIGHVKHPLKIPQCVYICFDEKSDVKEYLTYS